MTPATGKGGGEQPREGARGMGRGGVGASPRAKGRSSSSPPPNRYPSSFSSAGRRGRSERAPPRPRQQEKKGGKWSGDGVGVTAAEGAGLLTPPQSALSSLVPGGSAPRCRCSGLGEELPPSPQPIASNPLPFRSSPRSPCRLQNGANLSPAAPMEPPREAKGTRAGQQRPLPARAAAAFRRHSAGTGRSRRSQGPRASDPRPGRPAAQSALSSAPPPAGGAEHR